MSDLVLGHVFEQPIGDDSVCTKCGRPYAAAQLDQECPPDLRAPEEPPVMP